MPVCFKALGTYGKLGNALFEAAATIALAKRNNDSYQFPSTWEYKNSFNLPSGCFVHNINSSYTYNEPYFHYSPIPYKPNMNIHGYFQSYKYFDDYSDEIKRLFTTQYSLPFKTNTTSIHVRRTDYLNFPNHHPAQTMAYYEKAMSLVDDNKFLIFSDDINWCKQHFTGNHFEFSEGNNPVYDLALQSRCTNNIIANSSFSWWAGWLNPNLNKKIIAPNQWFGPALSTHNTKDLFPSGWIVI